MSIEIPFNATIEDVRARRTGSGDRTEEFLEIRLATAFVPERAVDLMRRFKCTVRVTVEDVQLELGDGAK